MSVNSFTYSDYQKLLEASVVLEKDRHGVKVLQTSDGRIVKLFRRKRLVSSAILKSYSSRFIENAKLLKKLGFHTIDVEEIFYCAQIKRTLVFYRPIPGLTLRTALKDLVVSEVLIEKFAVLLAQLHDKGVFFRSIHLNNIIFSDIDSPLGLIDISDMKIGRASLSPWARMRNFRHLTRYKVDQLSIERFGVDRFLDVYFSASCLSDKHKGSFVTKLQNLLSLEGRG